MRVNNEVNVERLLICYYDESTFGVPINHLVELVRRYLLTFESDNIPAYEFNLPIGSNPTYKRISDYIYSISLCIRGHSGVIVEVKGKCLIFYKFKSEYYYNVGEFYEINEESESNYDQSFSRQIPIYPKFIV